MTLSKWRVFVAGAMAVATTTLSRRAVAQTDFYNTDRGRPVQIEDAYATERYALELKLAPLRLERGNGGKYRWGVEPELAYGLLPRTHIEIGLPLAYAEVGTERRSGLAGLDISLFHNLNAETETWPALGLRADVLAPVGNLAPDHAYTTFTGIATRTYRWARFHVNGQYTAGAAPSANAGTGAEPVGGLGAVDVSRWLTGIAVDKTYPLAALLITAEVFGREPIVATGATAATELTAGAGARLQLSPTLALDAGIGRRLTGGDQGWYVTFGSAYAFGLRSLFPGR
jgi:hypothetical protein